MDNDPIEKKQLINLDKPPSASYLGDIEFNLPDGKPIGGLNPHNPSFDKIGNQFRQLLIDHIGLNRKSRILDVGCGTGRLAKSITKVVDKNSYSGFDVNRSYVDYCNSTYDLDIKHFDIQHDEYNRYGTIQPEKFEFPYEDQTFNIITGIALFNHFRHEWIENYVRQMRRVLKPKGMLFITILVLNNKSINFIDRQNKQPYSFRTRHNEHEWYDFGGDRELFNVAHKEEMIRRCFISNNMMIKEPIKYGQWCLSKIGITGPDVIIAQKNR